MDFHSLARRELQALCKKNKIPANITNVAMADALKALDTVEGLEDILMTVKTSADSPAKTEIKQIIARTTCKTSTRRKPVLEEPQTTQISTRTRGGARRAPAAAPVDMVCRKMEIQLKEAAEDEKKGVETPAVMTAVSRRKTGMTSVKEVYSTRRTTRLLEKKPMGLNLDNVDDDQIVGDAEVGEEMTSVKEVYSTRRTTRLLEKKPMGLNLDNVDDDQIVGDAEVGEEMKINEESVVANKEMEVEGISKQINPSDLPEKTCESEEKHAVLLEDNLMGDNNEPSLDVQLHQKTEVLDESVNDKNADADVIDENNEYLESGFGKMESTIDGSADGFVLEKEVQGFTKVKEIEADSFDQMEMDQEAHKATNVTEIFIGEEKPEEDSSPQHLKNDNILAASEMINKDEPEPEKNMIMVVAQINEENSKEVSADHDHQMKSEEAISFQKCDQVGSWPVIFESKVVDHSEAEATSPKATGKSNAIADILLNKENLVKVKTEKVKMATEEMSMRQLKKMLKQLKTTHKNTNLKEDEDIAKMGKDRSALQPLSR